MKNNKVILIAIILIAIVGIGFLLLSNNSSKKSNSGKNGTVNNNSDTMSNTTDPTLGGKKNLDPNNPNFDPSVADVGGSPSFLLKQYEEWAKYPPYSRPISKHNRDLTEPFVVPLDAVTMADTPETKEPNGYRCHFQPKTWAVIGEDTMYITLECRNSIGEVVPVKINDQKIYLYKEWEGTKTSVHTPDYNDSGTNGDAQANDNIITFSWKPMKQHWGQMFLEVEFTYSKENKKGKLSSAFFSSPNKPAEFQNDFREAIEDGSLVIYPSIIVYKEGNYTIEANLKDSAGNYICFSSFVGKLKSGSNQVRLLFFGRILREKEFNGPYILSELRAHRDNLPLDISSLTDNSEETLKKIQAVQTTEPDKELVYPYKGEYKTNAYEVTVFSTKVWESEEKNKRIEELKALTTEKQ